MSSEEQRQALRRAVARLDLTLEELWRRYFALGGDAGLVEVEAYLHGLLALPPVQGDVLAHAVNERLDELPRRVPYRRTIRHPRPDRGPLAALVTLLEGAHRAAPEQLPAILDAAAHALNVRIVAYLVDFAQRRLVPLGGDGTPLAVDTTLPGRAFREVEMLSTENGGQCRLWVPLLDGAERLGVLDVTLGDSADVADPLLREQLQWLAALLGHLVASMGRYGDALVAARLERPRTPAAELIWGLLPPLSASTSTFSLAGILEPSETVGGDALDYALSEAKVQVAIFDAMGHALGAGLIAAAAVAAYRSARRAGRPLDDQARAVDETVSAQFPDAFLTGVLVELDLATGRLRYLAAGHPHPLLLRNGRVVKTLTGGRRLPLGVTHGAATVGEESLEPGDWIVLYTDGITEARDETGAFFGEERLRHFLEREAASGNPPAETVRRLVHAVMTHQNGVLQDDASVLLARWDTSRPSV